MKRHKQPNRRQVLGAMGALPVLGVSRACGADRRDGRSSEQAALALVTKSDRQEHERLWGLDLDAPEAAARREKMPTGRIGDLTLGRIISGSNLISMNMHSRDLKYVYDLAAAYNTEDRVLMTLKLCEEHGINSIVLKNHNFRKFRLSRYWDEWGGRMKWLADVITTDINKFEALVEEHLELGAASVYLWGGASDIWYYNKQQGHIVRAYEIMRKYKVPVGICAHQLAPIMFCEKEGLKPDYYMKTLHHDRYWSAHPEENRRFLEMYEAESPDHAFYHDNMFCHRYQETIDFMKDVKVPWIAFKVLAAGAIPAKEGLDFAFASGADFVCLGMFDFQVRQDAALAREVIAKARSRIRPWMG